MGTCPDYWGKDIEIGVSGNEVHVEHLGSGTIVLVPSERDEFLRLYTEAVAKAEKWADDHPDEAAEDD